MLDESDSRGHSTLLMSTSAGQLEDCQEIKLHTPGPAMVAALEKIRKRVSCIDCQLEAILALMIGIDCLYLHIVTFFL